MKIEVKSYSAVFVGALHINRESKSSDLVVITTRVYIRRYSTFHSTIVDVRSHATSCCSEKLDKMLSSVMGDSWT